jgi:hypothetical protein
MTAKNCHREKSFDGLRITPRRRHAKCENV